MTQVLINGILLEPQPAETEWMLTVVEQKLDGTEATGAYQVFSMRAPPLKGQTFNWLDFENQVLTSITCYAPGTGPEGASVTYSSGAVARKIQNYQQPSDRTVRQISLEVAIVV